MEFFVEKNSIVRKIWGKSDTILFIFAGASAEFALNKAVDWLYFTGKLPADPLGRLFSTVRYARMIVFASKHEALHTIDAMTKIHKAVEEKRETSIPDWAYRDVLFMLIYYSIASYELLERKLSTQEKNEVYDVFYRVGKQMQLKDLPRNYSDWLPVRDAHLESNLYKSSYTVDLFKQYKKHLGTVRYRLLLEAQKLVAPLRVKDLMNFGVLALLRPVIPVYKMSRFLRLDPVIKRILLPPAYTSQISELDIEIG